MFGGVLKWPNILYITVHLEEPVRYHPSGGDVLCVGDLIISYLSLSLALSFSRRPARLELTAL